MDRSRGDCIDATGIDATGIDATGIDATGMEDRRDVDGDRRDVDRRDVVQSPHGRRRGRRATLALLDDGAPVDDERLYTLYAYPESDRPVVRGNAIMSLDGGATIGGTSGGLGGSGDRRLFAVQREMADVIVVGAGTAREENYRGARMTAGQRQRRHHRGQPEVPPIALVTRSGVLEHDLSVLTHTEVPPLVLTCADSVHAARAQLGSVAEVIDCSRPSAPGWTLPLPWPCSRAKGPAGASRAALLRLRRNGPARRDVP